MKIKVLIICLFTSILASADNGDLLHLFKGKSSLPAFMYNSNKTVYGISDPGMDTLTARSMAVARAIFVQALRNNASMKMITDCYDNKQSASSYEGKREKCISLANLNISPVTYSYDVVNEFTTDRGETFVCLKITDKAKEQITVSANCDIMAITDYETKESNEYKILMSVYLENENKCDTMDYSIRGSIDNPKIMSVYKGDEEEYYRNAFWYYDEGSIDFNEKTYALNNGLWCAIIQSLCDNLASVAFDTTKIININNTYNSSKENSYREFINSKVSCLPKTLGIKRNKISFKWDVKEL